MQNLPRKNLFPAGSDNGFEHLSKLVDHAKAPGMTRKYPLSSSIVTGLCVLFDSAAIIAAGLITHEFFAGARLSDEYLAAISFIWIATVLLFQFARLYQFEAVTHPIASADKIIVSVVISFLFLLAIAFSLKVSATFSRAWFVAFVVATGSAVLAVRVMTSVVVGMLSDLDLFSRTVVIAGGGDQAKHLIEHLERSNPRFLTVSGIFTDDAEFAVPGASIPVHGGMDQLLRYARNNPVDDIFIALPWSADDQMVEVINKLRELPINIYLSSDLIGFRVNYREPPSHFGELPIFEVMGKPLSGWDVVAKSVEDYILAATVMVLLLPFMLLVAIAIKLDSPGPILFRQKRLGFNNQVFDIYKFRTMRHAPVEADKTVQAQKNDPRITRLGQFLRRSSIDELPQLLNVLNGTMSLVGPRPHALDHNEDYAEQIRGYFARHRMKPGITGWAQVKGLRGATDTLDKMEARVSHDVYYTENWSLLFDLQILFRTIIICITGKNAY